jgi:hypothetical protein
VYEAQAHHSNSVLLKHHFGERISLLQQTRQVGEARITFHHHGVHSGVHTLTSSERGDISVPLFRNPVVEGHVQVDGEWINIQPIHMYRAAKMRIDPDIPTPHARPAVHRDATMIAFKDSDRRGVGSDTLDTAGRCAFDEEPFNIREQEKDGTEWKSKILQKRQSTSSSCATATPKIAYVVSC